MSASTVLHHIRQLEEELAAPLITRGRGPFELSRQGALFMPLARSLVTTALRAKSLLDQAALRLAASSNVGTYLLQAHLAEFQAHCGFAIELWVGSNPEVAARLECGEADLGLMEWWDDRTGFRSKVWRREPLVVIVGPHHKWAHRRRISLNELATETLLGGEAGTGTRTLLVREFGEVAAELRTENGFGSTEAVKRAVQAGRGVSIVLASAVSEEVAAGRLVALMLKGVSLGKDIAVVLPRGLPQTSPAATFSNWLCDTAE